MSNSNTAVTFIQQLKNFDFYFADLYVVNTKRNIDFGSVDLYDNGTHCIPIEYMGHGYFQFVLTNEKAIHSADAVMSRYTVELRFFGIKRY